MLLHNKYVLVQEGSSYPKHGTFMGVSISVLAMKQVLQVIARLNFILWVRYDAMLLVVNGVKFI